MLKKFLHERLKERTTLDGAILIAAGIAYLVFKPVAVFVAYGAIAYGLYTLFKSN